MEGDIVGLIGPNGSGKTTLINCIMGLIGTNTGKIEINGLPIVDDLVHYKNNFRETRKLLAFVPDEPKFYDHLSPFEYLQVIGKLLKLPNNVITQKINLLFTRLKITRYRHQLINTLSRGNRQRLSIAVALLQESQLLIMDEPMNTLDPGGRIIVRDMIRDYCGSDLEAKASGKSRATLVSSHLLKDLEIVCNKVILLNAKGHIAYFGDLAKIKDEVGDNSDLEGIYLKLFEGDEDA